MKILLLTDRMDVGGAETHVATLARGLQKEGIDVAVQSTGGRLADELRDEGIEQYALPPLRRSLWSLIRARSAIRRVAESGGFDLLHAHARLPALLLRGCEKWKGHPIPAVTAHAVFRSGILLERVCYWGRGTVAVSEDLRAHLCDQFGVPAETVTVIPNGIDCERFSPPDSPPSPHSILFASRLDADCSLGAELLCDVAPALAEIYPDLQITLAGGGNVLPYFFGRAEQINRGRKEPLIRTLGSVSDMPSLLRKNRIFVGVSRAAMEAAACGCAVLLCGNEGYAGVLSPSNPAQACSNFCGRGAQTPSAELLLAELSRLLGQEELIDSLGRSARSWMLSHFDAERSVAQTCAFYRRLLFQRSLREVTA